MGRLSVERVTELSLSEDIDTILAFPEIAKRYSREALLEELEDPTNYIVLDDHGRMVWLKIYPRAKKLLGLWSLPSAGVTFDDFKLVMGYAARLIVEYRESKGEQGDARGWKRGVRFSTVSERLGRRLANRLKTMVGVRATIKTIDGKAEIWWHAGDDMRRVLDTWV